MCPAQRPSRLWLWRSSIGALVLAAISVAAVSLLSGDVETTVSSVEAPRQDSPLAAENLSPPVPEPNATPIPKNIDFQQIESQCIELTKNLRPAVVGVLCPSKAALPRPGKHTRGGTGVIISANGLVLSQMHVSHMKADTGDFSKPHHMPGEKATVLLADGTEVKATLLGADLDYDLSLLQLPGPGPYSFARLADDATVRMGDWIVKLGHPHGFRKDRPAPVRLGRVLLSTRDAFATDCPIVSGDSGGPFFGLDGRLVGILGTNDAGIWLYFNGLQVGARVVPGITTEVWAGVASPCIAARLASMKKGEINPQAGRLYINALAGADRLPRDELANGKRIWATLDPATRPLGTSVVTILNSGVPVALGTVVDEEGVAVVMASALPPKPRCRLPDGTVVDVVVVGVDRAYDLAVIRVPARSIRPAPWVDHKSLPAGSIVSAVGAAGQPISVGVVSVAERSLSDIERPSYALPLRVRADRPGLHGEIAKDSSAYVIETVALLERVAGLKSGDRLVSVAGDLIASDADVATAVQNRLAGDVVPVVIVRQGKNVTLDLPLLPEVAMNASNATWRSDDYPVALEYSPPVATTECGGPLVDRSGRVVGVTVGRANAHAGWAIPMEAVRKIVNDAKQGRLGEWPSSP